MLSKEYKATMLGSQTSKPQKSDGRENKAIENLCNLESEHDMIAGWTTSDKKYFLMKQRFGSPKVLCRSATQRNKHLLRCKINRSLNFDLNFSRKDYLRRLSPNSSIDNSCFSMNKPSRELSRSAKIMRALSNDISFRHRNENIKKSLTFEPSPQKTNSSNESTSVDSIINTPLHTPDKSSELDRNSTDISTTSSIPTASLESIDENQNRTPQQNRKVSKILSDISETKRSTGSESSGSLSGSISLLRSNLKERIDSITRNARTPDFQCLKQDDRLRPSSCDIAASTPRNLLKEFNNDEEDSPHTPENNMRLILEDMSSIKKSHKKERSYCVVRKALKMDEPMRNTRSCAKRTTESLEADDISTSNSSCVAALKESPKKSRNAKKALFSNLDDEFSDNESISNDAEQKAAPKNIDSSNDCEMCEENTQNILDTLPSTSSTSNHDEKENDSCLQEASSSNVNLAEFENKAISCKPDSASRRDHTCASNSASITDVISPKCQALFGVKSPRQECPTTIAGKSMETNTPTGLNLILSRMKCFSKTHKRPAFENERPITPENLNSSRLLLPNYTSVKKSHKKDKRKNKSISDISKYDVTGNESKKSISLSANYRLSEEKADEYGKSLFPPSSFLETSLVDECNQKRKRFMNTSLQSDKHKLTYSPESLFSRCQNTDDEFKIYTPIRKRMSSILDTVKDYAYRNKASPRKNNEPTETADTTDKNGRLTPVDMSTTELLCNIDSIKKSHKKDKHDGSICRKRILEKLSEYTKEAGDLNSADCTETSEDHTTPSLKLNRNDGGSRDKTGACSNTRNEDNRKSNKEGIYSPQPSTSRENSVMENKEGMKKSKTLSTTPPNNWSTIKFIKLLQTTSIKKSHKKERDLNAQSKYILMNHEYDLSDDGSIFDEEDKLT